MPQRGSNVLPHEKKMISIQAAIYISSLSSPPYKIYKFFYYKARMILAYIAHISYLRLLTKTDKTLNTKEGLTTHSQSPTKIT